MDQGYRLEDARVGLTVIYKPKARTNPERHFHGSWEVLYLASGERTFFHGADTWRVSAGDALVVRPQVLHRALNKNDGDCSLYNLYFPVPDTPWYGRALPLLERCASDSNPVIPVPEEFRYRIVRLFSDIGGELGERGREYESAAWGSALLLLVDLTRFAALRDEAGPGDHARAGVRREVAELISWLEENYAEPVDLASLSSRAGLSPAHLSRLFHRETRYTLTEYLAALRVREACRLLAESGEDSGSIAERCGFGSLSQFARVFRGHTGQSPIQWRKSLRPPRY